MADDLSARLRAQANEMAGFPRTTALLDEAADALDAAPPLGEGTVEWGVRYEWIDSGGLWVPRVMQWGWKAAAIADAVDIRNTPDYYRNVEVVSRRRYVTDWQPVESQP